MLETLRRHPPEWRQQVLASLNEAATKHEIVIYSDPNTPHPVRIHVIPSLLTNVQCVYLKALGLRLRRVLNRLLRSYHEDAALQAVLPLSEDERRWLSHLAPNGFPEPLTVFERLDTNLVVDDPHWHSTLRFLEFNSVGIGCIHFMPVTNQIVAEQLLPAFQEALGSVTCRPTADPRALLATALTTHAKAIGRKTCVVAFVERRETAAGGADEMLHVSRYLQEQGLHAFIVDPRDLAVRDGELVSKDIIVDLVYRDSSLAELISIETHGGEVGAMKHAFQHNQVISGLTGEFDHKSLCELLSSSEYDRYFTLSQRRTFHAVIPWTRLLRERKTIDPEGREVDLSDYVRKHREGLVLKPNRSYGGQDIVIGMDVTQMVWEEATSRMLADANSWVVQELVSLPQVEFIDLKDPSATTTEFVTVGFIATPEGIAFVGRSSTEHIVNVSRGGSMVPLFLIG